MGETLAKRVLNKMPNEVFDIYIAPIVRVYGWTFTNKHSPTSFSTWSGVFGKQSLETIANLDWKRREISLGGSLFHPRSQKLIGILYGECVKGKARITNVANSQARFDRIRSFVKRTGRLPAPVILMKSYSGLLILDGHHRIAALLSLRLSANLFSAWVGSA